MTRNITDSPAPSGVLIVAMDDGAIAECVARLQAADVPVTWVSDVYSAMGFLARGEGFRRCLVDPTVADRAEREFLRLVPRYFPKLEFGVLDRVGGSGPQSESGDRLPRHSIESIAGDVLRSVASEPSAATDGVNAKTRAESLVKRDAHPVDSMSAADHDAPSADGRDDGPTLHEAVRRRMSAGRTPPAVRRRPPGKQEPVDSKLTAAEVSALLQEDEADDGASSNRDYPDGSGA